MKDACDVVVVGGGPAGLAAATLLGRAGRRVVVLERAQELGGRARTTEKDGYCMNFGAHALYRHGAAWRVLERLGVPRIGGAPRASGTLAWAPDGLHALPVGLVSLLTTGLLSVRGKLELSRLLASLGRLDPAPWERISARAWLETAATDPGARGALRALLRVATYTGDLEALSAGAAIAQLQHVAEHGVLYLDGGWQRLVEGLRTSARDARVELRTGDAVVRVERRAEGGARVVLQGGQAVAARAVLLAVGPRAAAALLPSSPSLAAAAAHATPVRVSTLDLALSRLPRPRVRVAFGTEVPLYFSVHSAAASLAPPGGAVLHVMRYGTDAEPPAQESELEGMVDRLQPGWREHVVHRRFLPAMTVAHDLPAASRGGLAGRPDVALPDVPGAFVLGDWVGPEGMLFDAALASAERAAEACLEGLAGQESATRATRDGASTPLRTVARVA